LKHCTNSQHHDSGGNLALRGEGHEL
jgi:hypothetical protein